MWSFRGQRLRHPHRLPDRERAGWTGDWQLFVPTAAFLYDVAGFSTKWLRDLAADQWPSGTVANIAPSPPAESEGGFVAALNGSAGWGDAAVIVPWELYRAYGDARLLDELWPTMVALAGRTSSARRAGSATRTAPRAGREPRAARAVPVGHRLPLGRVAGAGGGPQGPTEFERVPARRQGRRGHRLLRAPARLMSRIAELLGRDDGRRPLRRAGRRRARRLAGRVRRRRRRAAPGHPGQPRPGAGLRPRARRAARRGAPARLVELIREADTHLGTGFLATPYLLPVLADTGHLDVAYELLFQDTSRRGWP